MTQEDELRIIKKVIDGDADAFEELLLANQKNVYNLALKMTGNAEDALDISQEAFFKAFRLLGSFRGDSRFSVWIYRITHNLCIDFLRKSKKATTVSLTYQDESGDICDIEIADNRELPESAALRREMRIDIATGIGELEPNHREILIMREITGMSYDDIAQTLGINEGTVKSRLARARGNLAKILMGKGTFPAGFRQNEHKVKKEVGERE